MSYENPVSRLGELNDCLAAGQRPYAIWLLFAGDGKTNRFGSRRQQRSVKRGSFAASVSAILWPT